MLTDSMIGIWKLCSYMSGSIENSERLSCGYSIPELMVYWMQTREPEFAAEMDEGMRNSYEVISEHVGECPECRYHIRKTDREACINGLLPMEFSR